MLSSEKHSLDNIVFVLVVIGFILAVAFGL